MAMQEFPPGVLPQLALCGQQGAERRAVRLDVVRAVGVGTARVDEVLIKVGQEDSHGPFQRPDVVLHRLHGASVAPLDRLLAHVMRDKRLDPGLSEHDPHPVRVRRLEPMVCEYGVLGPSSAHAIVRYAHRRVRRCAAISEEPAVRRDLFEFGRYLLVCDGPARAGDVHQRRGAARSVLDALAEVHHGGGEAGFFIRVGRFTKTNAI